MDNVFQKSPFFETPLLSDDFLQPTPAIRSDEVMYELCTFGSHMPKVFRKGDTFEVQGVTNAQEADEPPCDHA